MGKHRHTDQHSPDGNKDKQTQICHLLQREEKRENMVWHTLAPAVEGMECIAGIRRGDNPLMMGLVKTLVDKGMVETSMDPVDTEVGKRHEQRELEIVV